MLTSICECPKSAMKYVANILLDRLLQLYTAIFARTRQLVNPFNFGTRILVYEPEINGSIENDAYHLFIIMICLLT